MRFSAKGEYGVRAILDIALYGESGPVRVKEIARRQAIPIRFLEQVMTSLKQAGLVESYRGAHGGYRLKKSAKDINLADVIQAVEGPITVMECINEKDKGLCDQISVCVIRDIWCDVQRSVIKSLSAVTLESVIKKKQKRESTQAPVYQI